MRTNKNHRPQTHPGIYMFLILPFGIVAGNLTVTLAYTLSQAGVTTALIAELIALSYLPHTWKFLWAPMCDTTLSLRKWYMLAAVTSAVGMFIANAMPATTAALPLMTVVVVITNVAVTFLGMAVEALMAHGTPGELKGRAAGWFQAGNVGGAGVGGGVGLWIVERTGEPWIGGAVMGAVCLLCCIGLRFVVAPPASSSSQGILRNSIAAFRELWSVAHTRIGYLGLLICFLPIGTGAASNLWSAIADDWQASADAVATANGLLTGVFSAIGCIAAGYICDRMDRKYAYASFGLLLAVCAVAMALAPRTQSSYITFVLIYAFILGMSYAGFSAVVLEAIGGGAAATKYSMFASLSNAPIAYMTVILGWAQTTWDTATMLYTEALFGVVGIVLFAVVVRVSRHRA